jgi:hypothetical protein
VSPHPQPGSLRGAPIAPIAADASVGLMWLGMILAALIVSVGTFWAFDRGAPDFSVFYAAWRLVLEGRGAEVYQATPDRFLYAPGFAWILSPLALLPRNAALALWCFLRAAVVGYLVREFQARRGQDGFSPAAGAEQGASFSARISTLGLAAWGVVVVARPLLIDFQYGQVNTLIAGACAWALLGHFRRSEGSAGDFVRWFVLGAAAMAKIFPLPLLALPWVMRGQISRRKLWIEYAGVFLGLLVMLLLPAMSVGLSGAWELLHQWRLALVSRGMPLESHNQSFMAFLHHYFSGELTHVVAAGMNPVALGSAWISEGAITLLSYAWMAVSAGFMLAWLLSAPRRAPLTWIAVMIGLLILPSHLVWKPYFVMALPAAILAVRRAVTAWQLTALIVIFVAINLTGFDVVGHAMGARLEAASVFLWAQLGLLWLVVRGEKSQLPQAMP